MRQPLIASLLALAVLQAVQHLIERGARRLAGRIEGAHLLLQRGREQAHGVQRLQQVSLQEVRGRVKAFRDLVHFSLDGEE